MKSMAIWPLSKIKMLGLVAEGAASQKVEKNMGGEWFEMWFADKQSLMETMVRNMAADLECGYNYFGDSITRQRQQIAEYKAQFDSEVDGFKAMEERAVERWCYYDMKKRGAIA